MEALALLGQCKAAGLSVLVEDGHLVVRGPKRAAPLMGLLRQHKLEIMAILRSETLPSPAEVADSVEACLRLGQRLRRGEITALRCGITGSRCTFCQGVPCLGSTPWAEPDV